MLRLPGFSSSLWSRYRQLLRGRSSAPPSSLSDFRCQSPSSKQVAALQAFPVSHRDIARARRLHLFLQQPSGASPAATVGVLAAVEASAASVLQYSSGLSRSSRSSRPFLYLLPQHPRLLLLPWISRASFSPPISTVGNFRYMEELSPYEAAYRIDSEIQTIDAGLQQRTNHVISNLAVNIELHSLSFDTLKEVISSLLDINHDVVRSCSSARRSPLPLQLLPPSSPTSPSSSSRSSVTVEEGKVVRQRNFWICLSLVYR